MTDGAPRRVVLKLSGEAFADPAIGYGIDPATVRRVALEISDAKADGTEIAVVVGGGNIFRGNVTVRNASDSPVLLPAGTYEDTQVNL